MTDHIFEITGLINAALGAEAAPASPSAAQPEPLPLGYIPIPHNLNPDTARMVCAFAAALAARLALSENKPRRGNYWQRTDWRDELVMELQRHVTKGDPRDVAAYCAFAWHHGWDIAPAQPDAEERGVSETATAALAELIEAMDRYQQAADTNAPTAHRAMMERARAALSAARASAPAAPEVVGILRDMTALFEMTDEAQQPGTDSYTVLWQAREFLRSAGEGK